MPATRIFPFSPGGAAFDTTLPSGGATLADLSAEPRFGLKGPGTVEWLTSQGIALPEVNRSIAVGGMRLLRLGGRDILLTGQDGGQELAALIAAWDRTTDPRGYSSWREEGWAWMRLSGAGASAAMASLCAIDLRPGRFGDDEVAQTRVGHVEAVVVRARGGFDVFFDMTMSAFFGRAVAATSSVGPADSKGRHR